MDEVGASPWIVGALATAISTLAGVVVFLFKRSDKRDAGAKRDREADIKRHQADREVWMADRAAWLLERSKIELEYEVKLKEHALRYIEESRLERESNRDHEDTVRKEFAELMESVAAQSNESAKALVTMLHKFYDRFVGPRRY